jgi:hypothetical protein
MVGREIEFALPAVFKLSLKIVLQYRTQVKNHRQQHHKTDDQIGCHPFPAQ